MPNGDWQFPGRPFPDDYGDERTADQLVQDLRRVRNQVGNLRWRGQDEPVRHHSLSRFQQRMQDRGEQLQIEAVPRGRAADALVVSGELLMRSEQLEDSRVDSFLHDVGFRRELRQFLDGLKNRVVRLVAPGMEAERRHEIAHFLRRQGMHISLHHVTPLGQQVPTPVGKALATPEPTSSSVAFTARQRNQVEVAVIDTGIAVQPRDDGWLQEQDVPRNSQNIDPVYYPAPPEIGWGQAHGYSVTGVVQQVEPGALVTMYRALNRDGVGDEAAVATAMVQAVRHGAQILNLSLGTMTQDDQPPLALQVALELIEEIERDSGKEVVVVAAAGNYGTTRPCWPAAFRRVVSVAGVTPDGQPVDWSSRGFWVTCSAVGQGVLTPYVEGTESWELDPDPDTFAPPNPWALWSGTSFAAPQVAGAIARLCQYEGLAPTAALRELLRRGRPVPDYGRVLHILPGT
jgi:subtilisin family serine protease